MVEFDAFDPEIFTSYMDFKLYEEIGFLQRELGEDAYLNPNLQDNGYTTFNPILNLGGIISVIMFGLMLYSLSGLIKLA